MKNRHQKIHHIFSPLVFHRLRPHELGTDIVQEYGHESKSALQKERRGGGRTNAWAVLCRDTGGPTFELRWGMLTVPPARNCHSLRAQISTPSKCTRPFWGTDCRRAPKSLSFSQIPLFAVPASRELESACRVSIL